LTRFWLLSRRFDFEVCSGVQRGFQLIRLLCCSLFVLKVVDRIVWLGLFSREWSLGFFGFLFVCFGVGVVACADLV